MLDDRDQRIRTLVRFVRNERRLRERAGLSQENVAFLAGVHPTEIGLLERYEPASSPRTNSCGRSGVLNIGRERDPHPRQSREQDAQELDPEGLRFVRNCRGIGYRLVERLEDAVAGPGVRTTVGRPGPMSIRKNRPTVHPDDVPRDHLEIVRAEVDGRPRAQAADLDTLLQERDPGR